MLEVLNLGLYRALEREFGHVTVVNAGEAAVLEYSRDFHSDRLQMKLTHGGENYAVNCPECADTRRRLYFHHLWGVRDTKSGGYNLHLMFCHHHGNACWSEHAKRQCVYHRLTEIAGVMQPLRVKAGKVLAKMSEMTWPGECVRLDKLASDHRARAYLAGRGYDPDRLARFYNIHYCEDSHLALARQRIVVPIYHLGKMVGCQTRLPLDMNWKADGAPPKWWTVHGTPKSRILYNGDEAAKYRTGVVVEGAADVWGFGPMSQAVLGSAISLTQKRLLIERFQKGSLVILLDPEEMQKSKNLAAWQAAFMGKFRYGCAFVQLPLGTDPGSLDREWSRSFVTQEAKGQQVKVSWQRK